VNGLTSLFELVHADTVGTISRKSLVRAFLFVSARRWRRRVGAALGRDLSGCAAERDPALAAVPADRELVMRHRRGPSHVLGRAVEADVGDVGAGPAGIGASRIS